MTNQKNSKVLNITLWIFQILLAVTFIWAGAMKLFQPNELPWLWTKENPELVTITGILDVLAGFGLILPSLLRIQPKITIYAAYGTIALMISASIFHIMRGEGNEIGFNIFMLLSAIFIAWGRLKKAPIEPKK
ncbi:DoxX family protein [Tenacibaculum sp. IB213877]|uniref:DoxX family protein n=1 Tax=Tenacibaculum sp. IB213877 TaxID=3097351 RepID=UPI002A5A40C8|nr:DoxX family protein [Tenacibaculum sp. IB213877]MDY0780305.1 DoxX family protein [Tenacibaculum sp. IB213877]